MAVDTPFSNVAVANMAIDVLEDDPLVSLQDNTVMGRWMSRNYGFVRDETIELFPWNFAKTRVMLPVLNPPPAFGWRYQAQLPEDSIRPLEIREAGHHNAPPIKFEHEGDLILTDYKPPIPLIYLRRVLDPTKFTPLFARVFAMRLARYAAQSVTGKQSYVGKADGLLKDAWEHVRLTDSLASGTPQKQNRYDIIDIRGRGLA